MDTADRPGGSAALEATLGKIDSPTSSNADSGLPGAEASAIEWDKAVLTNNQPDRLDEIATALRVTWGEVGRNVEITRELCIEARDLCRASGISFDTWIKNGNFGISKTRVYELIGADPIAAERQQERVERAAADVPPTAPVKPRKPGLAQYGSHDRKSQFAQSKSRSDGVLLSPEMAEVEEEPVDDDPIDPGLLDEPDIDVLVDDAELFLAPLPSPVVREDIPTVLKLLRTAISQAGLNDHEALAALLAAKRTDANLDSLNSLRRARESWELIRSLTQMVNEQYDKIIALQAALARAQTRIDRYRPRATRLDRERLADPLPSIEEQMAAQTR